MSASERPITALDPKLELRPVWRMQWATGQTLDEWSRQGVMHMTADRLAKLVKDAQANGFETGELAGRFNLRLDIERGKVPPIAPLPTPSEEASA